MISTGCGRFDPPDTDHLVSDCAFAAPWGDAVCRRDRDLARLSNEQAGLRRVAALVAQGTPTPGVFEAVTREAAQLSGADLTLVGRCETDGTVTGVAAWSRVPVQLAVRPGFALAGLDIAARVQETGRAARVDGFPSSVSRTAGQTCRPGPCSAVGCPIVVAGCLWGVLVASSKGRAPLPSNIEEQLAGLTELTATAIMNARSRAEVTELVEDQTALRRVATLVARGARAPEVVPAVAAEVGHLLSATDTITVRLDPDGMVTVVSTTGDKPGPVTEGSRWTLDPDLARKAALAAGHPARQDARGGTPGDLAAALAVAGIRSTIGLPIVIAGRPWGALFLGRRDESFPAGAEQRLAAFTELVAIAVTDSESVAQLAASRARVIAASDEARKRIERDLHDGVQQRLVTLGMQLREVQNAVPQHSSEALAGIDMIAGEITDVLDELREISRGIHPAILSDGGLGPALRGLARRSGVPVELDLRTEARSPRPPKWPRTTSPPRRSPTW